MKGYLGITGHFILDWTMHTVMLQCKRFKGKHSAENIRHEYEETLATYDISNKICSIITDNASNMMKAFNFTLPGYEPEGKLKENVESEASDSEYKDEVDIHSTEVDSFECLPNHIPCYAHTLQLVIKDGLKEISNPLRNVIAKSSKIVSFVRKSIHASELLEDVNRLQAANVTRWNSQLTMLRSILKAPKDKLDQLDTVSLTSYERKLLQELCTILEPFEYATNQVQGEKHVTASLTIPVTRGLRHRLQQISAEYNNKLVSTLKESINSRLCRYEDDETCIVAATLDPRFKLRWCQPNVEDIFLQKAANQEDTLPNQPHSDSVSPPPAKARSVESDFFGFMSSPSAQHTIRPQTGAKAEMEEYLSQPCTCTDMKSDPLAYWKAQQSNYPILSKLACRCLSVPATSAPVERLFSIAGKTFRPDRCRLKDDTFEHLMMIKCNNK